MKIVSSTLALALGVFATFSSASQIKGFVSGYAPSSVQVVETSNGTDKYSNIKSDFVWSLGGEMMTSLTGPVLIGGGVGFISVQKDGGVNTVMPAIPVWASVEAVFGPEVWKVRPYVEARVGYAFPAAKFATWWGKPLNFIVGGNIGALLPYHMGVEINCTYLSMDKIFKTENVNYRLNSLKIGGSITVNFDLSKNGSAAAEKKNAAEPATVDVSVFNSNSETNTSSEPSSNEDPYSNYGDSAEQSAEASEESAADDTATESAEEDSAEEAAEESTGEEASEAESAEEAVAEAPAEEPKAEAPAPAAKPAAKKVVKKTTKKTTKKAAKKTTKKSTKKATKKTTKKKK